MIQILQRGRYSKNHLCLLLNEDLIDLKHLVIQNVFLNDILLGSILKLFQLFGVPIPADYGRR